jgi:hypothetical protein
MTELVHAAATLIGLGSASMGMTGLVSTCDRKAHVLGIGSIAAGVATVLACSLLPTP